MNRGSFPLLFSLQLSLCLLQSMHLTLSHSCSKPLRDPLHNKKYPLMYLTRERCHNKGPAPLLLPLLEHGWPLTTANHTHVCVPLYPVHAVFLGARTVPGPRQVPTYQWKEILRAPAQCSASMKNKPSEVAICT